MSREAEIAELPHTPPPDAMPTGLRSHPRGLLVLSATELAERFSYYGMVGLLVLYMTKQLLLPGHAEHVLGLAELRRLFEWREPLSNQAFASLIYGWYAGLVYFTPLVGGWIADRWLGARRTVTLGALLMAGGHLAMSFDQTFLIALLLLICGSGCLKGNISAQVAPLYPVGDESRRARGFTIFSTGINIGAVAGPLVTGALAQAYGWHVGFACAALLMAVALFTYLGGQKHLRGKHDVQPHPNEADQRKLGHGDRLRLVAILLLILVNVPIAASYYQITNVGLVWLDRWATLDTPLGAVPATWFNSLDSFASIVVAAPLLALWAMQSRRGGEPDSLAKVMQGALINAAAPLILVAAILMAGEGQKVSAIWPMLYWIVTGIAFMYYWPLTLEIVAARSPEALRSRLMGAVFLALFAGNLLVGWVGSFYELMTPAAFFGLNAAIGFAGAIILFPLMGFMRRHLLGQ
ncbi:peptide MFS transporter [Sphingomonas sabuli]|uniref:Peptide MFS transporter n=1 Tax=Sphingomonas sabuli TaxID=2764186 RepID=A0A7G9L5E0_9SPHN|nr:peptide MFS transporter [Sphingomonas sabuli]QNM83839.1 peptide MFS transporter [Sphingomonas sabuli]